MDLVSPTPLFDLFRRGEVSREVKLLAAKGVVAPRAIEQLSILVYLATDSDQEIATAAARTLDLLPAALLASLLGRRDVPHDVREYLSRRGVQPGKARLDPEAPLIDLGEDVSLDDLALELEALVDEAATESSDGRQVRISSLPILQKLKLAMRGTREQRVVLIRDANKMVAMSVLSSPKLTESEVETFARMANVSDDVLRIIGLNRSWTKNYAVVAALSKNPKTPPTITMPLVSRLNERDLKGLSIDRNVPEGLRIAARKLLITNQTRRT